MIEKLYEIDIECFPVGDPGAQFLTMLAHINETKRKVNELVDAVNNQQIQLNEHDQEIDDCAATVSKMEKVETRTENLKELAKKAEKECRFNPVQADREVYKTLTRSENVQSDTESRSENVQDPTKWLGKLCKFWDMYKDYCYYGILTKIRDISPYYYECNNRICYAHCEPVSEDLIYKGK